MFSLEASPYLLSDDASQLIRSRLTNIEERIALLRSIGTLTPKTIADYYGQKRFEQVAESNAIEGSTLSVGETELAVLKGITITGHDPAYVRDAVALDRALTRVAEIARNASKPIDIERLHEIHALILGERKGGGVFRSERVSIRGASHSPPKTWSEIMSSMEDWQAWSINNKDLPAPIRSAVLHAWLTHVHPYIDGNGRVSRAIGNLELIRAGYPPIIIKKKERERYIEALAESDDGGDIRSFFDLTFDRIEGALTGLETAAKKNQGHNPVIERIQRLQDQQLSIWTTGVRLLASVIEHHLTQGLEKLHGICFVKIYENSIDLEDYVELCAGHSVPGGWAFLVTLEVPGVPRLEKLAFIGHRSSRMYNALAREGGPSLYWSHKNPSGFPKWAGDGAESPYAVEITSRLGRGDQWVARLDDDTLHDVQTTELAERISNALMGQLGH